MYASTGREGNQAVKRYHDAARFHFEAGMLAKAQAAGCAPPVQLASERLTIILPWFQVMSEWLSTASALAVQQMARSVLACLERLHAVGICHRDAHRDNIVLDGENPLLIDFELACTVSPSAPCYDLRGPASGVPLPEEHRTVGIPEGVWWGSPTQRVRALWQDLGHLNQV